jgi:hypothetical protein
MMTVESYLFEFDGRVYAYDPQQGALSAPLAESPFDISGGSKHPKLNGLITDYGTVPQLREVCGRPRYLDSVLAKLLRDEGEAVMGSVIITDSKATVDERCSMVMYQVMERSQYKRYVNLVDASSEPCLLHSLSRLFAVAAAQHRRGSSLLLFAHHEVLDLVAVEAGAVVGFRRMAGMFNGQFRSDRLAELTDQVNALHQHLRTGLEQVVAYQWLFDHDHSSSGDAHQWVKQVAEHLQMPLLEPPAAEVLVGGEHEQLSHWLPLIDQLGYRNSSAPSRNRWLAAAVALMPLMALALLLGNAALFTSYAVATLQARSLDADIQALNQEIVAMQSQVVPAAPEFQAVLAGVEQLQVARRWPGYAQILAELAPLLNSTLVVELDGVRMTYPTEPSYRRVAAMGRDAVASASGEGVLIELAGSFIGDAMTVMDTFDELSRRLSGADYRLLDSEVSAGARSTDFILILERLPNEE